MIIQKYISLLNKLQAQLQEARKQLKTGQDLGQQQNK